MPSVRSARLQVVIVAFLCFVTARFGWFLASERHGISPFWPPSGVALALLLLWGRQRWPSVLIGTVAAHVLAGAISPLTLTSAAANTLEAFLGASIARSFPGFNPALRRLNDLAILLLAILVATLIGSALGTSAVCAFGRAPWSEFVPIQVTWWMGDGMGALLLSPLILTWAPWRPRRVRWQTALEGGALLAALLAAGYLAFSPNRPHHGTHTALEYLPLPVVIWAALRFELRGAALASTILGGFSLVSYAFITNGNISSGLLPTAQAETLLLVQTSVAVILLTGLVTAAIQMERDEGMRALARSEARYRTLYNRTPVALHSIDTDGRIVSVSDYWLQSLGYARSEVLGRRPSEFMTAESRQRAEDVHLPAFVLGNDVQDREFQFVRKNGDVQDVLLSAVAERDQAGRLVRSMTVLVDVTARRRAEAERHQMAQHLHEARQLESLGLLAGGISHDFSNLLTSILGSTDLARTALTGHPATVHLDEIERAAGRATALCRQMQAYAGQARLQLRRVALNALVEEMVAARQPVVAPHTTLSLQLARELPPIEADPTQVRQVIGNLLDNAIEAVEARYATEPDGSDGSARGRVTLVTSLIHADRAYLASSHLSPDVPAGLYVMLDVQDNGAGMTAETRARIFDPFFTTKFTGRGLGLPAVLGIVRSHLGAVWVMTEEGRGTTARVLFPMSMATLRLPALPAGRARPAAGEDPPHASDAESAAAWRTSGLALVIDDEASVRTVMRRMLGTYGLQALTAEDGEAGLAVFRERRAEISVVLLDLTMPGLDGEQVHQRLRAIDPRVPIVIMTGFSQHEAAARYESLELEALLQKPFRIDELQHVLRQVLRPTA